MEIDDNDQVEEMFHCLSSNDKIIFKSEKQDTGPLNINDKYNIAKTLFARSPGLFLEHFYRYLTYETHAIHFESLGSDDFMVLHYLQKLKNLGNKVVLKNRRFKKLNQLLSEGKYFSHEQMKTRQPLLYERYIGTVISDKSQEEKLGRCYDSFSGFLMNNLLYREDRLRKNSELLKEQNTSSHGNEVECVFIDVFNNSSRLANR